MKYLIYNDNIVEYVEQYEKDIRECLNVYDEPYGEKEINEYAQGGIEQDFVDLKCYVEQFDKHIEYDHIKVVACLGLWYGKRKATKSFDTLQKCIFELFQDYNKVFFERKNTTLTLKAIHHDGENIFKFYMVVNGKQKAITIKDFIKDYGLPF